VWAAIVRWITGDLVGQLTKAYETKLRADTDERRIIADVAIRELESKLEAHREAAEIRRATAGFWEMRLITFLIASCFTLHLVLVTLDTCFRLGWRIPAFPHPFDEWQGAILLSFFGIQAASQGISAIAAAIRSRR